MLLTVDSHFCSILRCSLWTMFRYSSLPRTYLPINRNLLKGGRQKRGSGDSSPSAGFRGRAPVVGWGWSPQKPETRAEYSTEHSHRSSQIAYCSVWLYFENIFSYDGGTCTHVTLATPLPSNLTVWARHYIIPQIWFNDNTKQNIKKRNSFHSNSVDKMFFITPGI